MSLEFVNRICPICKNPNYMMDISDVSKTYKYRCFNCFKYFNDNDFEPLYPAFKTECMNKKVDMVEVVRCRYCIHYRYYGFTYDTVSECAMNHCENPDENWFCADGERRDDND